MREWCRLFNSDILGLSGSHDTPQQAGKDVATLTTAWYGAINKDLRSHCIFLDDMEPATQLRLLGLYCDDLDRAGAQQGVEVMRAMTGWWYM